MKLNRKTAISTSKVLLVPYESHHVHKYHGWMQDPKLREATGSEPLSLEEEYQNQVSWRKAHDKLTFIVCKPVDRFTPYLGGDGDLDFIRMNTVDKIERIVGDVNFFLHPYNGDSSDAAAAASDDSKTKGWLTGEVDIMIADPESRQAGMGRAAVCALLVYVQIQMGYILEEYVMGGPKGGETGAALRSLMAKIKEGNAASRGLFESLGFRQRGGVNYFGEVEMIMDMADLPKQPWWDQTLADWLQMPYGSMADEIKWMKQMDGE